MKNTVYQDVCQRLAGGRSYLGSENALEQATDNEFV